MTDQKMLKKQKVSNPENTQNPSQVEGNELENKKIDLEVEEKETENKLLIEDQAVHPNVNKKLNRLIQQFDLVVILKDFPNENIYRGYLCEVSEVQNRDTNPDDSVYQVIFEGNFANSLDLSKPNRSAESAFVCGRDFVRLETEDLRY